MAPVTEEAVNGLKDIIGKLEVRIEDLENRLTNGSEKPKTLSEKMRIILMGPPGAGMPYCSCSDPFFTASMVVDCVFEQGRVLRLLRSKTNFACATL